MIIIHEHFVLDFEGIVAFEIRKWGAEKIEF